MADALNDILIRHIRDNGPMGVATFMGLALGHPEHGYYMRRDPFGRTGDFITAPEISQMFGEMVGLCLADYWARTGAPDRILLAEAGPGRGTLMADILRATKHIDGFHRALSIHLIETSTHLRGVQAETLNGVTPVWHDTIDSMPHDTPVFFVGNEFLDALPIVQLTHTPDGWSERAIGLNDAGDGLAFGLRPAAPEFISRIPGGIDPAQGGGIYETSPARDQFTAALSARIERQGGMALFIDYGHTRHAMGDTLQAMRAHQYVPVLDDPGTADITSHVDFQSVAGIAAAHHLCVYGAVEQSAFLCDMGIETRAAQLARNAKDAAQTEAIQSGLRRLVDPDQMGALFKVVALCHDKIHRPAGFEGEIQ